jgi:hypothetical protein
MIYCVTSHVDLSADKRDVHPNANLAKNEYIQMLDWMMCSFQVVSPTDKKYVLSNQNTQFPNLSEHFTVVRTEMNKSTLMFDRMVAQSQFLENVAPEGSDVCFLDTDILLNKSFESVWKKDFDVALTYRKNDQMPINGGFILARNNSRTRDFFKRCLDIYQGLQSDQKQWWGDQISIAQFIGDLSLIDGRELLEINGLKILLLDCGVYNFTPKTLKAISSELTEKYVLHFKGDKKQLMGPYWNSYLLRRYKNSPLSWIRSVLSRRSIRKQVAKGSMT